MPFWLSKMVLAQHFYTCYWGWSRAKFNTYQKRVISMMELLLPISDWCIIMIGPGWYAVRNLPSLRSPNFCFMGEIGKKKRRLHLNMRNIFARSHTQSTLANLRVIILLSEMLKCWNFIFSKSKNIMKDNNEYLGIFHLLKWVFQN
jgi:hypothetical protein